jgi:hypothetical protein
MSYDWSKWKRKDVDRAINALRTEHKERWDQYLKKEADRGWIDTDLGTSICFVIQNELQIDFEEAANLFCIIRTEVNPRMTNNTGVKL